MALPIVSVWEMVKTLEERCERYREALEDIRCATQDFHDADPECEYKHSEDYCDCDRRRANKALFPSGEQPIRLPPPDPNGSIPFVKG